MTSSAVSNSENHSDWAFQFPENSKMELRSKATVDLSNIKVDLEGIFVGGIGYGGGASKLSARTMEVIGHGNGVYNLPFCIEAGIHPEDNYSEITLVSIEDKEVGASVGLDEIKKALQEGYTQINIPITLNGHESLVGIAINNQIGHLRFYDSLSNSEIHYSQRYSGDLIQFIKSLIPDSIKLKGRKYLHLLDQGDGKSTGCGYYTLFTAFLLKEREDLRNLDFYDGPPEFTQEDDKKIRAELVVRSLLEHGLDNADTRTSAILQQPRDFLYNRIQFEVIGLIEQLRGRVKSI